jgi:hypothetical protein
VNPIHLLQLEMRGFLILLAAIVAFKMLTGRIHLSGLLARKQDGGQVSPERIQLLLATMAMGAKYLSSVLHASNGAMPDVSPNWLYVFGGSSGIYASVKAITTMTRK